MSDTLAENSLFERIGGKPAVSAAVELFYHKVLEDDRINYFFADISMERMIAQQKAFFVMAMGGPSEYTGKDLRAAHRRLVEEHGLSDVHFDAVMEHLGSTLVELEVQQDMIDEAAALVEGARDDVLNR